MSAEADARGGSDETSPVARAVGVGLVVVAAVLVAFVLFGRGGSYHVTAEFDNAGQLVKGSEVRVGGVAVGTVTDIKVTDAGTADVTFSVDAAYAPLRVGTEATIKPTSLSGIANRFIDLQLGPDDGSEIADGGRIEADHTNTAVELDEVFSLFDSSTRSSLRKVIRGQAVQLRGEAVRLRRGIHYLNPALSTGSRLFEQLTRDEPLLKRFLVDSSTLVHALAERRGDLTGVVSNLNATFGALGSQQEALADSVQRLPPFLRRANTTFVNLRATLDDVDPLVNAAKPVATRLGPFLDEARVFAHYGEPTIRDLSETIRSASTEPSAWARSRRRPKRSTPPSPRSPSHGPIRPISSGGSTTSRTPAATTPSAASRAPGSTCPNCSTGRARRRGSSGAARVPTSCRPTTGATCSPRRRRPRSTAIRVRGR
jgi:phospholipid/cholesterol/gamma-HCH transport system substrate-binding protein